MICKKTRKKLLKKIYIFENVAIQMENSTFSELLCRFRFRVRGRVKHEKARFVCDIRHFIGIYVRYSANALEKNGKTLRRESAQGGHLFTICARFADVCMVLQNVKGLGLFCGA